MSTPLPLPPPTPPPSPATASQAGARGVAAPTAAASATEVTALLPRRPSCEAMELRPLAGRVSPKMENAGFEREESLTRGQSPDRVATVELSEVASSSSPAAAAAAAVPGFASPLSVNGGTSAAITCSEHCQALHMQHQRKAAEAAGLGTTGRQPPESPWHHLKTVFLVGTLVFLALWIVIYTLLSQLSLL